MLHKGIRLKRAGMEADGVIDPIERASDELNSVFE